MKIVKDIINFIKKYIKIIIDFIKNVFNKRKAFLFVGIIFLVGFIFVISRSFAVGVPVESITFTSNSLSYTDNQAGSWKVVKSAKWISKGKARITYDVSSISSKEESATSTDYVLVVDGTLFKQGAVFSSAFNNMLGNMFIIGNRVAVIGFRDEAGIVTGFLSDSTSTISAVNGFLSSSGSYGGSVSYYNALSKVDEFLKDYTYKDGTNLEVIFVTDGKPGIDTPSEVAEYKLLKQKYSDSNIKFKAIQYEMGSIAVEEIKNISDEQIVVDKNNVSDVLGSIYFGDDYYGKFILNDKIAAPFTIDDASVSVGKVDVIGDGSVSWDLASSLIGSGSNATMSIDVSVGNNLVSNQFLNISNDSTSVTYNYSSVSEMVTTDKTPILASSFSVSYDSNAPKGCVVSNMPNASNELVYDIVRPSSTIPVCSGYKFKGWEIVTDGVKSNNDGSFIMPYKAVTLKATWAKTSLNLSMNGKLGTRGTLYGILEDEATSGSLASTYNGQHQDNIAGTGINDIYYYHANSKDNGTKIIDKNNVVFAGICWQMIRTTDTGGVKMLYNGEVASDGTCGTDRGNHVGYVGITTLPFDNATYDFGTDYSYNEGDSSFTLSGGIGMEFSYDNASELIGKYTNFGYAYSLFQILEVYDSSMVIAGKIQSYVVSSDIGNIGFNYDFASVSSVGYMRNDSVDVKKDFFDVQYERIDANINSSGTIKNVTYDETSGMYSYDLSQGFFGLVDIVGHYIMSDVGAYNNSAKAVRYGVGVDDTGYYYINLENGKLIDENATYVIGDGYIKNSDNTYTITNPVEVPIGDFYVNYRDFIYNRPYFSESVTAEQIYVANCNADKLSPDTYKDYFAIDVISNYKISNNFTYNNGHFELTGDYITTDVIADDATYNYYYTCLNDTGVCDVLYYLYYIDDNKSKFYIKLYTSPTDTIDFLFDSSASNNSDSMIKKVIDSWYEKNLIGYSEYLEDTIFCNSRGISDLGGFNPGSALYGSLVFNSVYDLSCADTYDRFSVSNNVAKLKYPIGLLTMAEASLMKLSNMPSMASSFWLSSPKEVTGIGSNYFVDTDGTISYDAVHKMKGVRPVITLKGSLKYTTGDGSRNNPYVVETK